jgi:hypothetical protein
MFSKQSYTGAGIVQPTAVSQVGQNLARGIEKFGQGIGQAFESAGESKKLRRQLLTFSDEFKPDDFQGTDSEWSKMFSNQLEDTGLPDLKGMMEGGMMRKSIQMLNEKIEGAKLQNQQSQIGIDDAVAQNNFRFNLFNDPNQSARQAAQETFKETGSVPNQAFTMAQDEKQAEAFAQGTGTEMIAGASLGTMQAIDSSKAREFQEMLSTNQYNLSKENTQSLIDYREQQVQSLKDQTTIETRKHELEVMDRADRGGLSEEQAKQSMDLWNKLNSSEPVKNFKQLNTQYQALEKLMLKEPGLETGASDIAAVFTFMKTLDPQSVVREGEFQTASDAGGLESKMVNLANQVIKGKFLSPAVRQEFLVTARQSAEAFLQSANDERLRTVEQGKRFGIPDKFSGGDAFHLRQNLFNSADDALEALNQGHIKPSEVIHVLKDGKWKQQRFE